MQTFQGNIFNANMHLVSSLLFGDTLNQAFVGEEENMNTTSNSRDDGQFDFELFAAYMVLILVFVAIIIKYVLLA